ncbi:hypothetical protein DSO57_1009878 [Entomophthora muscae]|uniref:Uncharacterized protein n=1 Tax=Entomophthora muscae TaxID=34485 RepID=A0ACC2SJR7_9FUNG|nr:hypothetical protein DSO57_1009878 [Entomophthora muscae]
MPPKTEKQPNINAPKDKDTSINARKAKATPQSSLLRKCLQIPPHFPLILRLPAPPLPTCEEN